MGSTTGDGSSEETVAPYYVPFFYQSTPGPYSYTWEQSSMYHRADCMVWGETKNPCEDTNDELPQDTSRCFNCGDPDHKVSACQLPSNRELIALSRQYHQFFHGSLPQWKRIHSVESWRQQRLDWLESFAPGEIKGQLLRSALTDSREEWLKNICAWGYPPGWISEDDPRERARARIWSEHDADTDSPDMLKIFGEDDTVEEVSFSLNGTDDTGERRENGEDDKNALSPNLLLDKPPANVNSSELSTRTKRWATYPNSYFSSDFLIPYTPPAVTSAPLAWDDTSFADTAAYLRHSHHNRYIS